MGNKSKRRFSRRVRSTTSNKNIITLETKLNRIYNKVDLRTTCCGQTTCCKTGCPQMNYSEFAALFNVVWKNANKPEKIEMICTCIEYFFHNDFEKHQMKTLVKPCVLLSNEGKCSYYLNRPLSCRMYGLWPKEIYIERVDTFERAYEGLVKREDLPLCTQCPNVTRVDNSKPLTKEVIEDLYGQLDDLDGNMTNADGQIVFTKAQIENRENYRTFQDWLLLKVFGEEKLADLTDFSIAASAITIDAQVDCLKKVIRDSFTKEMPNLE